MTLALGQNPLTALAVELSARTGKSVNRPNVVLIVSDEHQFNALGCYGSAIRTITGESPTPNLDRLAAEGVLFDNAYTSSPLCAPARASLMTGVYPHVNTALYHKYNGEPPGHNRFPGILTDMVTIGDAFRRGGYATAAIGKMHVHGEVKGIEDLGFDYSNLRFYTYYPGGQYADYADGDWDARYKEIKQYARMPYRKIDPVRFAGAAPDLSPKTNPRNEHLMETLVEKEEQVFDDLVAEDSRRHLARCVRDQKPFFLYVGFEKSHEPWSTHQKYLDLFSPASMELPASWDEITTRGRYPFVMNWLAIGNPKAQKARNTVAAYYACVREMDTQVGKVVQQCKDLGIYDNTIFIYTSDHGDSLYHHSLYEKHCMFEMAAKVPLIIRYPKALPQGKRSSTLVSLLDVPPTLLALTGQTVPEIWNGVSLLETLDGKTTPDRIVFSEFYEAHHGSYQMFPHAKNLPMRMARYQNYKYVYTHGFIEQLYDLKNDPDELNNLALTAPQANRALQEKLRLATLNNWKVDDRPLFEVATKRQGARVEFTWQPLTEAGEYILYRSTTADPLKAIEIGRTTANKLTDAAASAQTSYYWVVGVQKLERTWNHSVTYAGVPVATRELCNNLPASMPMKIPSHDGAFSFDYIKQDLYD